MGTVSMHEQRRKVEPNLQLMVQSEDLVEVVLHVWAALFGSIIENVLHRAVPEARSLTLVQAREPDWQSAKCATQKEVLTKLKHSCFSADNTRRECTTNVWYWDHCSCFN
jgi:hypothetical protein